jgi:glutamate-1-semialdehyde 2,1-aminomutase
MWPLSDIGTPAQEPTVDPVRVRKLLDDERARFVAERPRTHGIRERARASMPNGVPMQWFNETEDHPLLYVDQGKGAHFTDVDGHRYVDMNIADMSMFCGYAPEPIARAVAERVARGSQFLLPTEDSVWVAEELARRWGLPRWQFTLSASQANTEVMRLARVATGREIVLLFDGKYHGHFDEGLVGLEEGRLAFEEAGPPREALGRVRIVQFNDPDALREALVPRDVAVVLAEPAMTNNNGLIQPLPGFLDEVRAIATETGTLLAFDETHTLVSGPGGLVRRWDLRPDLVSAGKSIAGGIPLGAYGMSEELAAVFEDGRPLHVATGGTLFANALSMAAARAALGEVLSDDAYERTANLGGRLADGLERAVAAAGLPWSVHRMYARSGISYGPDLPRNALEAKQIKDPPLTALWRLYLANRGVWEAIPGAGPTVSVPCDREDVDRYVELVGELLGLVA